MAFDARRYQVRTKQLIDRFGYEVQLRRTTYTGDPVNPTETDSYTTVLVLDGGNDVTGERDSENVAIRERVFYLPYGYIVPRKGDVLVSGDDNYEVIRVDTTSPSGEDIIYRLVMRT